MGEDMREDAPILSFTSHARRLPLVDKVFRSHVENAEAAGMRVCLALQEDSVPAMTPYQRSLVESGKIELLTIGKDHGSNTKWTLCRAKYPDATMVVVDDDELYPPSAFVSLIEYRKKLRRDAFLTRAWRPLPWRADGSLVPFLFRCRGPMATHPVHLGSGSPYPISFLPCSAIPEHWAACLYPPGFPDPATADEAAQKAFHDDDVFIMLLAARASIPIVAIPVWERNTRLATKKTSPLYASALAHTQPDGPGSRTRATLSRLEPELRKLRRP